MVFASTGKIACPDKFVEISCKSMMREHDCLMLNISIKLNVPSCCCAARSAGSYQEAILHQEHVWSSQMCIDVGKVISSARAPKEYLSMEGSYTLTFLRLPGRYMWRGAAKLSKVA